MLQVLRPKEKELCPLLSDSLSLDKSQNGTATQIIPHTLPGRICSFLTRLIKQWGSSPWVVSVSGLIGHSGERGQQEKASVFKA